MKLRSPRPDALGATAIGAELSREQRAAAFRACVAGAAAAVAILIILLVSERDAARLGFLLWFRHEGRGVAGEGVALLAVFAAALILTVAAFAAGGRLRPLEVAASAGMKLALAAAVAFMLAFPGLPQFENKSLTIRAVLFPVLALLMPAAYVLRRMHGPFPALADVCWTLALTADIVGNDLHWYGNWKHWDDAVHFANTIPLMIAIVTLILALERNGVLRLGFWGSALFALAIYTSLHGLWETSEYLTDRIAGTELQPGGMTEATRNNLASIAGSLAALPLLAWWDASGLLDRALVAPAASYLRQLSPPAGPAR